MNGTVGKKKLIVGDLDWHSKKSSFDFKFWMNLVLIWTSETIQKIP